MNSSHVAIGTITELLATVLVYPLTLDPLPLDRPTASTFAGLLAAAACGGGQVLQIEGCTREPSIAVKERAAASRANMLSSAGGEMLEGVMLLWFLLAGISLLFVAIDIRATPESPVLKWGFVLLTAYTGVFGAFLYVLGCREPLPGLHERYVAARWRQTLGSTMHCGAGDGVGILAGAVSARILGLAGPAEVILEYVLGFAFGWMIFQALFMRDMAGVLISLTDQNVYSGTTFDEPADGGMVPTVMGLRTLIASGANPATPAFWFVMSIGLLVGFVIAYPMNWRLVTNHLKHGMMTVRPAGTLGTMQGHGADAGARHEPHIAHQAGMEATPVQPPPVSVMAMLSFAALAAGLAIAYSFGLG